MKLGLFLLLLLGVGLTLGEGDEQYCKPKEYTGTDDWVSIGKLDAGETLTFFFEKTCEHEGRGVCDHLEDGNLVEAIMFGEWQSSSTSPNDRGLVRLVILGGGTGTMAHLYLGKTEGRQDQIVDGTKWKKYDKGGTGNGWQFFRISFVHVSVGTVQVNIDRQSSNEWVEMYNGEVDSLADDDIEELKTVKWESEQYKLIAVVRQKNEKEKEYKEECANSAVLTSSVVTGIDLCESIRKDGCVPEWTSDAAIGHCLGKGYEYQERDKPYYRIGGSLVKCLVKLKDTTKPDDDEGEKDPNDDPDDGDEGSDKSTSTAEPIDADNSTTTTSTAPPIDEDEEATPFPKPTTPTADVSTATPTSDDDEFPLIPVLAGGAGGILLIVIVVALLCYCKAEKEGLPGWESTTLHSPRIKKRVVDSNMSNVITVTPPPKSTATMQDGDLYENVSTAGKAQSSKSRGLM